MPRPARTGSLASPPPAKRLAAEREVSLELLPEAFARTGVHAALGPVTLEHLLHEWPFHDSGTCGKSRNSSGR